MRKAARSALTVVLVFSLLASALALDLSMSSPRDTSGRETAATASSSSSSSSSVQSSTTAGTYGGLRVTLVTLNDSSEATSSFPITIRRNEVVTDDRLLLYAARGPLEVELPAAAYYLVGVQVPLFPVAVRVRVLNNQLTILKIWIDRVSRRVSSFEVQDTDSTGRVAGWGNLFVKTERVVTPPSGWNATMVVLKSGSLPPVPYSDVRLVQSELLDVSVVGAENGGSSNYLQLRSASALQTTGISSLSFLGFASGYQVSYSMAWSNSDSILRELVQDGPTGG
jgi:hypothetical protein